MKPSPKGLAGWEQGGETVNHLLTPLRPRGGCHGCCDEMRSKELSRDVGRYEFDEEQISTVTGRAPSLKLCQELTLTMSTESPGRQPRDLNAVRLLPRRPQGASQRTGAAPTVRRRANGNSWMLAVVVVAERRPCHAAVPIDAVAEVAGCRRTPGRCPCIGGCRCPPRTRQARQNPAMPLQALPSPFSPEIQNPGLAKRHKDNQASDNQNGKAYRFNTPRLAGPITDTSQMADQQDAGFVLNRPNDDAEIEQMFVDLMRRRGWHNLPAQAIQQMLAYPPAKKWPLIYQDRLTEWQSLQRRGTEVVE